jgi:FlaA1/EpsC-like NDP-sugar epimerase
MVLQAKAAVSAKTIFTMVRFGNVLASSGSVIPKFRQQIKDGGPVTVTDFKMTRYFMTIPEAAQLIIQAGAMAKGGEVFLLDMSKPVRIYDLARRMVELSGLEVRDQDNPEGDIKIEEIGLRPGEKLYEELLISGDPENTSHPKIFKAHEGLVTDAQIQEQLQKLRKIILDKDHALLLQSLKELISGYQPGSAQ